MSWSQIRAEAPDLAAAALERFAAHKHLVLGTIRADGSPRLSGIELQVHDDELYLGGLPGSLKFVDLRRDPRFALTSTCPADTWTGDAKIAGVAVEETDPARRARVLGDAPEGGGEVFRLDVRELALVRLGTPADHLVVEIYQPGAGVRRVRR
jgi:hypothetical protein